MVSSIPLTLFDHRISWNGQQLRPLPVALWLTSHCMATQRLLLPFSLPLLSIFFIWDWLVFVNRKSFKILSLTMRPGLPHSPPSQARTSPLSTWPFCNIRLFLDNFLPKFLPLYKRAIRNRLRNTSLRSSPALAPLGQSRKTVHAALAPKLLRMTRQFKNFRELPGILSLPGWTS